MKPRLLDKTPLKRSAYKRDMRKLIIEKNSNAKGRKPNTTGCGIYHLLNNPVNIGNLKNKTSY